MLAYGDIWVMAPSDSYHNLSQTHIALRFYFFAILACNSQQQAEILPKWEHFCSAKEHYFVPFA